MGSQRFLAAFEGIEGGFAIGTSIVVALSFAGIERHLLIVTAFLSIIVNGFNGASLKYSSEHFLDELDGVEKRSALREYFLPALIEFISYFTISVISILPLLLINHLQTAIAFSIGLTFLTLFSAGYWRAYMLHAPKIRDAFEVTVLGFGIIAVGFIAGLVIRLL